jgi:phage repressor protein C with HTH and peptisase S24 domain
MQLRLQPMIDYLPVMDGLEQDAALVRELVAYAGTHVAGIAKKAGVSPSTLQRPANGSATTRMSLRTVEKLKAAYPNFPGWLKLGSTELVLKDETDNPDNLVRGNWPSDGVPVREIDLSYGMGATYLDVPVTEEVHHFPRAWLRRYTRSSPDKLFFAQGIGDSMEPTLHDSDLLLIDTDQRQLTSADRIWVLTYADCGMIKRLRPVPGGGVEVWSDKKEVSPFTAYDGEIEIIGRVVAVQRKL